MLKPRWINNCGWGTLTDCGLQSSSLGHGEGIFLTQHSIGMPFQGFPLCPPSFPGLRPGLWLACPFGAVGGLLHHVGRWAASSERLRWPHGLRAPTTRPPAPEGQRRIPNTNTITFTNIITPAPLAYIEPRIPSAKGAFQLQPRATPWVDTSNLTQSPERAVQSIGRLPVRPIRSEIRSRFRPNRGNRGQT